LNHFVHCAAYVGVFRTHYAITMTDLADWFTYSCYYVQIHFFSR